MTSSRKSGISLVNYTLFRIRMPDKLFLVSQQSYLICNNNIVYFVHNSTTRRCGVSKKPPNVQNMMWPTIQLHGRQIHDYVVRITLVHSMTGHSVVTYHNTLSNDASIYVIIRFYIIVVPFSSLSLVTYVPRVHDTSLVVRHTSTLYNSCSCQ